MRRWRQLTMQCCVAAIDLLLGSPAKAIFFIANATCTPASASRRRPSDRWTQARLWIAVARMPLSTLATYEKHTACCAHARQ